jgi:regulator of sirC expression with transglutaminase-like and TPR domain
MNKELQNLISLLDDSDSEVYKAVIDELLSKGLNIIPELEKAWELSVDEATQERLENVIHFIQFSHTQSKISKWISTGAVNLLEGTSYIAQMQYPGVDYGILQKEVKKISNDVYLSSGSHLTAHEKVKLLNYVFYELNHFTRNTTNFYSPQNSFINQVLTTRKGNPISLGILYLSVAHQVGLPIYGVNLPKSFILAYVNEFRHVDDTDVANDILFYINPYNKGAILNRHEIDNFIRQQKLEPLPEYYTPCDNKNIIQRLIMNLVIAYEKLGFEEKTVPLKELLGVFQNNKTI